MRWQQYPIIAFLNCRTLQVEGHSFLDLKTPGIMCHRLLHIIPTEDFRAFNIRFGSKYIMDKLYAHAAVELDKFLRHAMEKTRRALVAKLASQGFEALAHRQLAQGGDFQVRPLEPATLTAPSKLSMPPREDRLFLRRSDVSRDSLLFGSYGCLPDGYPAVDGLAWADADKTALDAFQMTVDSGHGMSVARLAQVLKTMQVDSRRVRLFWVVPSDVFDEFPRQPWLNVDGTVRQTPLPKELSELSQFVLAIPVGSAP